MDKHEIEKLIEQKLKEFRYKNIGIRSLLRLGSVTDVYSPVTGNSRQIGFFGTPKIAQPTTASSAASFTANSGTAVNDASTFDGYTIKQVVKALRNLGLLA